MLQNQFRKLDEWPWPVLHVINACVILWWRWICFSALTAASALGMDGDDIFETTVRTSLRNVLDLILRRAISLTSVVTVRTLNGRSSRPAMARATSPPLLPMSRGANHHCRRDTYQGVPYEVDLLRGVSSTNEPNGEIRPLFNTRESMVVRHDERDSFLG